MAIVKVCAAVEGVCTAVWVYRIAFANVVIQLAGLIANVTIIVAGSIDGGAPRKSVGATANGSARVDAGEGGVAEERIACGIGHLEAGQRR